MDVGEGLKEMRLLYLAVALSGMLSAVSVHAQQSASAPEQLPEGTVPSSLHEVSSATGATKVSPAELSQSQDQTPTSTTADGESSLPDAPTPQVSQSALPSDSDHPADPIHPMEEYGKQPKRILGIIPNFRAVSANAHLPPLSFKSELWLASQDTFDYSNVIFVGALAGVGMAGKSEPAFGQGAEGFGKYYWHIFVDGGVENYMTEAIVPVATREDPRYYTMGEGGFLKRAGYAASRLFVTRTNSGRSTFNLSEIVGAGAAAGIGNTYYPAESNPWVKTYQRWGTQVALDGFFNVLKEFWPDIDRAVFRGKY